VSGEKRRDIKLTFDNNRWKRNWFKGILFRL